MKIFRPALSRILFPLAIVAFLLLVASVSSRGSTTSGGLPPTFNEFLKQNAANEKADAAAGATGFMVIVGVTATSVLGWWYLRR